MNTTPPPDHELQHLAERYSQVLAWEAAVPNSANTATQLDELEHQVIRSGYTLEDLYDLLDEEDYHRIKTKS